MSALACDKMHNMCINVRFSRSSNIYYKTLKSMWVFLFQLFFKPG